MDAPPAARRRPRAALLLVVSLAATLAACGEDAAGAPGWQGLWRSAEGGEMTVTRSGDEISVTSDGETMKGRIVRPGRVEGRHANDIGELTYVLTLEGDRIRGAFDIRIAGEDQHLERTFDRVRPAAPAGAAGAAGAAGGGGTRNPALVGHWRHTETLGRDGVYLVTDTHLVLGEDGRYRTWTKSAGVGEGGTAPSEGTWWTDGSTLHLRQDGVSDGDTARFQVSGGTMLLGGKPYERL
jgi:hypothetical protein